MNMLCDESLLEVFNHCQNNDPYWHTTWPIWKTLVQVCQRWRRIIFASPQHLHLQLLCSNVTSASVNVKGSLDIWPQLPIVIDYQRTNWNGDENVIAALDRRDRVTKITCYGLSSSILKKLYAIQEPFPCLTRLDLNLWGNWGNLSPVLPESFLGGSAPRLQSCTLRGIAFPALPNLLISTSRLVRLFLYDIPDSGYILPDAMASCLATLPNLEELTMEFRTPTSRPRSTNSPPPAPAIIPSLIRFDFEGSSEYLEDLAARIEAPLLHSLCVTFSMDLTFIVSQLLRFIAHSTRLNKLFDAEVELGPWSVRMTDESWNYLVLGIKYKASSWQISSLVQLCNNLSPLLSQVTSLSFWERRLKPKDMEPTQLLAVFLPFSSATSLSVSGEMVSSVVHALGELTGEWDIEVLPELDCLWFDGHHPNQSELEESLDPFIDSRRDAYRNITVLWEH